jgi:hypothetical protein
MARFPVRSCVAGKSELRAYAQTSTGNVWRHRHLCTSQAQLDTLIAAVTAAGIIHSQHWMLVGRRPTAAVPAEPPAKPKAKRQRTKKAA